MGERSSFRLRRSGDGDGDRRGTGGWVLRAAGFVVLVAVVYLGWTAVSVVRESGHDQREPTGAIVVLGAAQYDGTPSPVLQARLDHALELWQQGVAPEVVLTGSKQESDRFTEAYAGFRYLLGAGVPESDMRVVTDGTSTYESLAAAARLLQADGVTDVVLVSDGYHNRRLRGIADEVGLDATVSPTTTGTPARTVARETALVAVGEVLGYRRLDRFS